MSLELATDRRLLYRLVGLTFESVIEPVVRLFPQVVRHPQYAGDFRRRMRAEIDINPLWSFQAGVKNPGLH